jgi:hypothetical protein
MHDEIARKVVTFHDEGILGIHTDQTDHHRTGTKNNCTHTAQLNAKPP